MKRFKSFASDNNAGVHPQIMEAMTAANTGHTVAYGNDKYTKSAKAKIRKTFGEVETLFVASGTAANVFSISALAQPYNTVICSDRAHIFVDECNAVENFVRCRLSAAESIDGKMSAKSVAEKNVGGGDVHQSQPSAVSITQATELGTVYFPEEITAITSYAHDNGLYVHMDGARICNAAASLGLGLREATVDLGVDVLSFGATKAGAMMAEAVIFFNRDLAAAADFRRKQGMQLFSKMRFVSAQIEALLSDDLWLRNAGHSNRMARSLAAGLEKIPGARIVNNVDVDMVFVTFPEEKLPDMQQAFPDYEWHNNRTALRLVCAFDTTDEDISGIIDYIKESLSEEE